jgi:cell division protein FtsW (lipid II flippase)
LSSFRVLFGRASATGVIVLVLGWILLAGLTAVQIWPRQGDYDPYNSSRATVFFAFAASLMAAESGVHMLVNLELIPVTGLTLPWVSFGPVPLISWLLVCGLGGQFLTRATRGHS